MAWKMGMVRIMEMVRKMDRDGEEDVENIEMARKMDRI
jgi:hypothetical protein